MPSAQVRAGGYRTPFEPFRRDDGSEICQPTMDGLALWCSKLAPKRNDRWLVAASWNNNDGNPVGAMAWQASNAEGDPVRGEVVWDDQPLSYDPRPAGDRESWGEHRPRYGGNGWWTGAVFPDARDVEISNPADVSATTYQLAPGATIVPQLSVPYYGALKSDIGWVRSVWTTAGTYYWPGSTVFNRTYPTEASPIAGYTAMAAHVFGPRASGQMYRFNDSYYYDSTGDGVVNPTFVAGTVFGYSVFYANLTPEQIPDTHNVAAPLSRPPREGDVVATYLGRSITYQESQIDSYGVVDEFEQDQTVYTDPIPAGTLVVYRWALPSAEKVAPVTSRANAVDGFGSSLESRGSTDDGINRRYGVNFKGSNSASQVNRSGKCYIFEWWRDQYVLHEGTYSIKQTNKVEVEDDRPADSSGPANSGGNPWPRWPSAKDPCDRFVASLTPYTRTRRSGGAFQVVPRPVTLTWQSAVTGRVYGSETITYLESQYNPAGVVYTEETVLYDPYSGSPPYFLHRQVPVPISYHQEEPRKVGVFGQAGELGEVTFVGTVERNSNGLRLGGCWQESPPTLTPGTGGVVPMGSDDSSNTFSDGTPASCSIYGAYYHGGIIESETLVWESYQAPGTATAYPYPNCSILDDRSGSGLPGFPGGDGDLPPLPPGGLGNQASSRKLSDVEIEYEIQAPIARGMTSRSYYYEKTSTAKGGTAQWNGSLESSTYTPESSLSTTLEFREPVTLIRDDLAGYEEVLFVVLEFDRKTGTFPASPPPPADRATAYYQRFGGSPIALPMSFKDQFPLAAWSDPRSWNWTQWMCLKDGVVYFLDSSVETIEDYQTRRTKVPSTVYRVSDGSFSPLNDRQFKIQSLKVAAPDSAIVYDHNVYPSITT